MANDASVIGREMRKKRVSTRIGSNFGGFFSPPHLEDPNPSLREIRKKRVSAQIRSNFGVSLSLSLSLSLSSPSSRGSKSLSLKRFNREEKERGKELRSGPSESPPIVSQEPSHGQTSELCLPSLPEKLRTSFQLRIQPFSAPPQGDELHHSGWNSCNSCHGDLSTARRYLISPSLLSGRIYVIDTATDPSAPSLHKAVEPAYILIKTGLAYPHTSHCLASGDIVVSCLGDKDGNAKGNGFLLFDSDFKVKGRYRSLALSIKCRRWEKPDHSPTFGYDFWYQPRHKTMISSSWGAPAAFRKGFNLQHVSDGLYGRHLSVYSWPDGESKQTMDLGNTRLLPIEIRFLRDPSKDTGFVGCALTNMATISVEPLKVKNWILPEMPELN